MSLQKWIIQISFKFSNSKVNWLSLQCPMSHQGTGSKWDVLVVFSSWFNQEKETGVGSGDITQWWNEIPRDSIHGIKTKVKQKQAGTDQMSGILWSRSRDAKWVCCWSLHRFSINLSLTRGPSSRNWNAYYMLNCSSHGNCFYWLNLVSWWKALGEKSAHFVYLNSCRWLPPCVSAGHWLPPCEAIFHS